MSLGPGTYILCECGCLDDPRPQWRWQQVQPNGWMAYQPPYDLFEKPIVEGGLQLLNYHPHHVDEQLNPYLLFDIPVLFGTPVTWVIKVPVLLERDRAYDFEFTSQLHTERILTEGEVVEQNPGAVYLAPAVRVYFLGFPIPGGLSFKKEPITWRIHIDAADVAHNRASDYLYFAIYHGERYLPGRAVWELNIKQL